MCFFNFILLRNSGLGKSRKNHEYDLVSPLLQRMRYHEYLYIVWNRTKEISFSINKQNRN